MLMYNELVSGVEADLMSPPDSLLPLSHLLRIFHREDQRLVRDLDLSGNNWNLQSFPFSADPGIDEYVLPVSSEAFGRPQFVEMEMPGTRGRRRVNMADLEDQDAVSGAQDYPGGSAPRLLTGGIHEVEVAIFRKGSEVKARLSPWPSEPVSFIVYHSVGLLATPRLTTGPVSMKAAAIFWDFLHSRVVMQAITYCTHISPELRGEIKQDHRERIVEPGNGLRDQWNKYRRQDSGEQDFIADGFSLGNRTNRDY